MPGLSQKGKKKGSIHEKQLREGEGRVGRKGQVGGRKGRGIHMSPRKACCLSVTGCLHGKAKAPRHCTEGTKGEGDGGRREAGIHTAAYKVRAKKCPVLQRGQEREEEEKEVVG